MARPKKTQVTAEAKPKADAESKVDPTPKVTPESKANPTPKIAKESKVAAKPKAVKPAKVKAKTKTVAAAAPVSAPESNKSKGEKEPKTTENLYSQLSSLLKKKKVSKRDIANRLSMSYQGFLNSFNKRNLRLEAWHDIADFLNIPFSARFENGRPANTEPVAESEQVATISAKTASSSEMEDILKHRLSNSDEKVAILQRQITILEGQLEDKQTIITLLREKIK